MAIHFHRNLHLMSRDSVGIQEESWAWRPPIDLERFMHDTGRCDAR